MKEDNIDNRIERIAESVGSKKAAMRLWETDRVSDELKRKVAAKRWRTYGFSAAASIVLICGVGLGIFLNRDRGNDYGVTSAAPVYRGGSCEIAEIQAMIDSSKYEMALQAINVTLADTVINPSFTAERQVYLRSLNTDREYELTWLKINVLVKSGKKTEAVLLLEDYVKTDGGHQKEAKILINDLTK